LYDKNGNDLALTSPASHPALTNKDEEADFQHITQVQKGRLGLGIQTAEIPISANRSARVKNGLITDIYNPKYPYLIPLISAIDKRLHKSVTFSRAGVGMVRNFDGSWSYGQHNLFLNSTAPVTQTISTIVGASYTFSHEGSGTITASGAGTGSSTIGSIVTIVATTTSLVLTCADTVTYPICNMGSELCQYIETGASAVYAPRWGYSESGEPILHDEAAQATNLVPNNQDLNSLIKIDTTATHTEDYGDLKVFTVDVSSTSNLLALNFAVTPGSAYTFSFFAKKGILNSPRYSVYDNTNGLDIIPVFDYSQLLNADTPTRIDFSFTAPVGCTEVYCYMLRGSVDTGDIYISTPQLETGATATTPIPTYGSTATRAADVMTVDNTMLGLQDSGGTVVGRFSANLQAATVQTLLSAHPNSGIPMYCYGNLVTYDKVMVTESAETLYLDGNQHTGITSWGASQITSLLGTSETIGTIQSGSKFVDSTMTIGYLHGGLNPLFGEIAYLGVAKKQLPAQTRAALALLTEF